MESRRRSNNRTQQAFQATSTLVLGLSLVCTGISGCFGCMGNSEKQAQTLVAATHQKMANGDLAGIYDGADQRYKDALSREKSDALFSAIANKLGSPEDCNEQGLFVMSATSGKTIRIECQTTFSKGAIGKETFVWGKSGDQFSLVSYHIDSDELIER